MKNKSPFPIRFAAIAVALAFALIAAACGSSDDDAVTQEPTVAEVATAEPTEAPTAEAAPTEPAEPTSEPEESATAEPVVEPTAVPEEAATAEPVAASASCEDVAAAFQTNGSANDDLPDPEVNATCDGDTVVVTSNQIPDFPYIETSPGSPQAFDLEFTIPVTPVVADETTAVATIGAIAVAVNGIPIYGPTEGTGGDVYSLGGGFSECGGHNGPTGYHYHTFDVTGTDDCLYSEAEAQEEFVLFGYAFDGYPIYGGIFQYTSSYELTDESLFATDTWGAHTYVEGLGDLDECNGRTDEDGNYAYYATEGFPYTLGCYRGVVEDSGTGGGGGGGDRGGPPGGGDAGPPAGDAGPPAGDAGPPAEDVAVEPEDVDGEG